MSAIKRDRGIKDCSHLIEGHGGMLLFSPGIVPPDALLFQPDLKFS